LSAILQALTRYSANDPQFPVNDPPLFAGTRPVNRLSDRMNDAIEERASVRHPPIRQGVLDNQQIAP
jgi:hypothetical protein